jgi:transcriptional regulator with XRE-family HTH domain
MSTHAYKHGHNLLPKPCLLGTVHGYDGGVPKKNEPVTTLGREIREARDRLRYSQDALGELLSVSGTIISRWETGRYKPPIESLAKLADIAGGNEAERDDLYARWVRLAGYREPRSVVGDEPAEGAVNHAGYLATTLEGAMGRAIIDQVPDPGKRLDLVLLLRQWAQQWREDAGENGPDRDPAPSPQGGPGPAYGAPCGETVS